MYVLYGKAELFLPHSASLKEKRKTIQSIVASTRKRFNISIAEVNHHELWQRSCLGFAAACHTFSETEMMISVIRQTLDQHEETCEVLEFSHEINSFD